MEQVLMYIILACNLKSLEKNIYNCRNAMQRCSYEYVKNNDILKYEPAIIVFRCAKILEKE